MKPRHIALLPTALVVGLLTACEPGASVPAAAELHASAARPSTSEPSSSQPLPSQADEVQATSSPLAAPPLAPSGSAEPEPEAVKRRYSVAAIGDSLSDPKAHGGGYLTYLAEHCKESRFDTYGKGGNMVSQMKGRFARDVLGEGGEARPTYSHVIVLGGIADVGSNETANRTVEKIQRDLLAMARLAHERGMTVVVLTIPPWGAYYTYDDERHRMMLAMNTWLRTVPEPVSHVVDVFPKLVCEERELCTKFAADKIHWNKAAHELVGELLLKQVFADCE